MLYCRNTLHLFILLCLSAALGACGNSSGDAHAAVTPPAVVAASATPTLSPIAQIGKKLFYETSLSASGTQSCASCHSPDHAFGPANDLPAQIGGADMKQQGERAAPNLTYLRDTPNFTIGAEAGGDNDLQVAGDGTNVTQGDLPSGLLANGKLLARIAPTAPKSATNNGAAIAMVPVGGFFWDGRADSFEAQARGPLLNPLEMGNRNVDDVLARLNALSYVDRLKSLSGYQSTQDKSVLLSAALFAIGRYESEDPAFAPFDSKYDFYLQHKATLSAAEARGLKLFDDPDKGNCATCHLDKPTADGRPPMLTDHQYEALGVPRNSALKVDADPRYFDLGLCGPARTDIYAKQAGNCGLFKTPSLRNVATRHAFFHNGVYHKLDDVLRFYVERDIHPEKFYPHTASGQIDKFNDLPAKYRANIDNLDAPLNRKSGDKPALSDAEIQDIIAFLGTLNDGYKPPHG